jgi:hypothetical protein
MLREDLDVGGAEDVPTHPRPVQVPEGGSEGAQGIPVCADYWEFEYVEDLLGPAFERDRALAGFCLWAVAQSGTSPRAAHLYQTLRNVFLSEGYRFTPAQPRQEAQFRDEVPRVDEVVDDVPELLDLDVMDASLRGRDPRPLRWNW